MYRYQRWYPDLVKLGVVVLVFFCLPLNVIAADVLLWRNKKISASVLTSATIVWVLFEWLNYNFLTILCFALVLVMLAQFLWSNASGMFNRLFMHLYIFLFSLTYVDVLLNFTALIKYYLFFMLTVHRLMYPVLFSQKNSL